MSNFSSRDPAIRLQGALARECFVLSQDIARLGADISGGTADIVTLQAFDFLAQQAQITGLLLTRLSDSSYGPLSAGDISDALAAVPLPRMQARLCAAVYGDAPDRHRSAAFAAADDAVSLWVDE